MMLTDTRWKKGNVFNEEEWSPLRSSAKSVSGTQIVRAHIVHERAHIVQERARVTRSVSGALTHKLLIRLGLGDSDP